jgi:hypothetical protein
MQARDWIRDFYYVRANVWIKISLLYILYQNSRVTRFELKFLDYKFLNDISELDSWITVTLSHTGWIETSELYISD